eukprot:TRINITY_DN1811_c0_g1_i4.p1 TRINITY_DN1811_c0_g1~~TRINITY_DN1811_c0_g1_i4.p1  ORF type:complete len:105 (-),score=47.59 TRINITY_DN1811_c0_g1_i4:249-563(-)
MIRRPPRSTLSSSSAASDVYKRQVVDIIPQGEDVELETLIEQIKTIARDGIEVGESSLEPLMFGAKKLVQLVIIEDDKISSDLVVELIQALGDVGVEIVAFNTA